MFAKHINAANLDLPIKRISAGKYLFGTKNIIAKIVNGKLLIRVGGGFMSAEEFIEQYGRMEMIKLMHQKDPEFDAAKANRMTQGGSATRAAQTLGIGDMRETFRESMANIKIYGESPKSGDRRDKTSNFKGKNLLDLENTYEAVKFGTNSPRRGGPANTKGSARGSPKNARIGSPGIKR